MNIWTFNHYAITPNLPGGTRYFDFGKELVKKRLYAKILGEINKF